jgi:hypothetical protein
MNGEFISLGKALKLLPYFKDNKQEVLAYLENVYTAFTLINPVQEDVLYKFVLTQISWQPRIAISLRNLDNWAELKEFLKNSYIEKRKLDFHASQLFKARQGKDEKARSGCRESRRWDSSFASLPCSAAVLGREKVHYICHIGCRIYALCKAWHRTASKQ